MIAISYWSGSRPSASAMPSIPWPSLKLLWDLLLLPRFMEILWLWFHRTSSSTFSSRSQIPWRLGWANSEPQMWTWVLAKLVTVGLCWEPPSREGHSQLSLPMPLWLGVLFHWWGRGQLSQGQQGKVSCCSNQHLCFSRSGNILSSRKDILS